MARARGFTLPELVAVLVITGVLAAVALPRLGGAGAMQADAARDQVLAALRLAGSTAVSHRRLVCVTVGSRSLALQIAAANPASSCSAALPGVATGSDGQAATAAAGGSFSLSPAGTLYVQPSGRITRDGAGLVAGSWQIAVSGAATPVTVDGETGHVE